ncbi:OsmC family protein [uncultured Parvibaculum sp.]|uniref:OsmC family protein n=1 Tax=uncultured Parvibaculum sp. TaxID=291828 RepID=UPI0030ED4226|tara:strand:- start:79977 stop:80555 length:579 start_codon:yes stop_codon:yes gene_type:complete
MSKHEKIGGDVERVNGLDLAALGELAGEIGKDVSKGMVEFRVNTAWRGRTLSETTVEAFTMGGVRVPRRFTVPIDEPFELLGENNHANPQEMLMAALNACMTVGYVANAALKGIVIEKLEIETHGTLDLRGFLGLDAAVPAGYETLHYTVRIKGSGSEADFREIHETVMRTSPNYFNLSRPIAMQAALSVES